MRSKFLISLALLASAGVSLEAQQAPPTVEPFNEVIDVRVVNLEAVVTDGKGERVRGLTAADFRLMVDGREVPIEYFTEVVEGTSATAPAGEGSGSAAPVARGEAVGRSYLVYVDNSFSVESIRNEILERLERDLALLGPEDRMAVLAFDGHQIEVLSAWTGDRASLAAALARARSLPSDGNRQLTSQRALGRDVEWVVDNADSFEGDEIKQMFDSMSQRTPLEARTQLGRTADAAAAALRGFEAPPGRKVMLLVSGGWSLGVAPRLYAPMLEAANRLGYTLYPVDAAQSDSRIITAWDGMAKSTGGRAVVSSRLEVFREVVADTGSYYWLGFTPAWKADDRRHRVTVEVRRPGLVARTRSGFSDLSKGTESAMRAESVLFFGGRDEEKRLIVQLGDPKRAGRKEIEVPVTIGIPVTSLALIPDGKGYIAETPLAAATVDEKGGRSELAPMKLRVKVKQAPQAGGYARFQTTVKLRDIEQRVVFTVHDPVSGGVIWGEASVHPQPKQR